MNKNDTKHIQKTMVILSVVNALLAVAALTVASYVLLQIRSSDRALMEWQMQSSSRVEQIGFCHDKKIVPCDEIEITKWNERHPDERFNIVR